MISHFAIFLWKQNRTTLFVSRCFQATEKLLSELSGIAQPGCCYPGQTVRTTNNTTKVTKGFWSPNVEH